MTGDDLTFYAHRSSVNNISNFFEVIKGLYLTTNGRLSSWVLSVGLAHGYLISSIFRAGIMLLLVYSSLSLVKGTGKTAWQRYSIVLLLLILPASVIAQAVVWRSGFYVYTTSTAVALCLAAFLMNFSKNKQSVASMRTYVGVFLSSLTLVMFVESMAILALSILLLIMLNTRSNEYTTEFRKVLYVSFFGALLGSLIMFSSPSYRNIASGGDYYRSIGVRDANKTEANPYIQNAYALTTMSISNNPSVYITMGLMVTYLSLSKRRKFRSKTNLIYYAAPTLFVYIIFSKNVIFNKIIADKHEVISYLVSVGHTLAVLAFLGIFVFITTINASKTIRGKIKLMNSALVLSILPFIFINPFGPRNMFTPIILINLVIITIAVSRLSSSDKKIHNLLNKNLFYSTLLIGSLLLAMFFTVYRADSTNNLIARDAIIRGETTINLFQYPFDAYLHDEHNFIKMNRYLAGYCGNESRFDREDICYTLKIRFIR